MSEIRTLIVDDSSVMRKIVELRFGRLDSIHCWCKRPVTASKVWRC